MPARWMAAAVPLLALAALAGCASGPSTLYDWGPYPEALAVYMRQDGSDSGAMAARLEEQVDRNAANGRRAPPGLHAHLALLHTKLGNEAAAARHLQAEKKLFPESAHYIDFLLKNAARSAAGAARP